MNVSLYQAAAAMNASARWQETISENLAAGPVPGARKREVSFSAIEAGLASGVANMPASRYLIPAANSSTNFLQGEVRASGAPLDFALDGNGFFEVQLPNGSHSYTRDGEFHLNAQGQLVTKQGYTVLSDGGPVQFDPNIPDPITVSPDGEISQGSEVKGRLRLIEFSDPHKLAALGNGYFLADSPDLQPLASGTTRVHQGYIEGSNMSPTSEMAHLITAMRLFEANQRVMQMQDERMGRAITELANPS
jgi:flagellar basal-body rod protein FlgF